MFAEKIVIAIPSTLSLQSKSVPTARPPSFLPGELELCVSAKALQGQALSTWNRFDFHAVGPTVVGYVDCSHLALKFPQYAKYVYGRCTVPLLKDPADDYEMQGRVALNDGPLSAALYQFIADQVDVRLELLAKQAQNQGAQKKRKNLEKLNTRLSTWMDAKFPNVSGMSVAGEGAGRGRRKRKTREPRPHKPPTILKAHRGALDLARGVTYPMRAVAYDVDGIPVPPGKVVWKSMDAAVAAVHPEKGEVNGRAAGMTTLTVENDQGLKSEPVLVNVHDVTAIKLTSASPIVVGSNRRVQLAVEAITAKGQLVKNPALKWGSSDERVATVSCDGWLMGGDVGEAEVTATADGVRSGGLEVLVDLSGAGKPKQSGQGRPQILLSGQHNCPFDNNPVQLDASDPIVYQRPYKLDHENNVFWINLQHPLAAALLAAGEDKIQWRTYHFQRVVDVYATLELRREFEDRKDLDVNVVLSSVQEHVTEIFGWAKADTSLFDVLYSADIDLASL